MAVKLFGFQIERAPTPAREVVRSPVPPENNEGGVDVFSTWGNLVSNYGQNESIQGQSLQNENLLIRKYREIAQCPEADMAIEEIVSDAIVNDENQQPVSLKLDNLGVSDQLKEVIIAEFNAVLNLMDFKIKGHDIFRRWYVDGRINYHKVIDETAPKNGIKELRYIDPRKIKKVREIVQTNKVGQAKPGNTQQQADDFAMLNKQYIEYWVYSEQGYDSGNSSTVYWTGGQNPLSGVKISKDAIAHCNSGVWDVGNKMILSRLHKALRINNQLRMLEDAVVIYTLTRSPERRVFYIDVGNLPKNKADQFLRDIMTKFKSKLVYNSESGEIKDDRRHLAMTEDFWLPRRGEGAHGTQIQTLEGGKGLLENEMLAYYLNKLFRALSVPIGRIDTQQSMLNFGKGSVEISREELKFAKYIARLRGQFCSLFEDLLATQLALKGIMSPEDWNTIRQFVQFEWARDNHFKEIHDTEVVRMRVETLDLIKPWIGIYFSEEWVGSNILKLDEEGLKILKNLAAVAAAGGSDLAKAYGGNAFAMTGAEFQAQIEMQVAEANLKAEKKHAVKEEELQDPQHPLFEDDSVTTPEELGDGSPHDRRLDDPTLNRAMIDFLNANTPPDGGLPVDLMSDDPALNRAMAGFLNAQSK